MRLAGGVPGTGHSVLRPGLALPDRWVWDDQGEAEVEEAVGQWVLQLTGRSGLHESGTPLTMTLKETAPEDDDDLRPLAHYTFEADPMPEGPGGSEPAEPEAPVPSEPAAKPKSKRRR